MRLRSRIFWLTADLDASTRLEETLDLASLIGLQGIKENKSVSQTWMRSYCAAKSGTLLEIQKESC